MYSAMPATHAYTTNVEELSESAQACMVFICPKITGSRHIRP